MARVRLVCGAYRMDDSHRTPWMMIADLRKTGSFDIVALASGTEHGRGVPEITGHVRDVLVRSTPARAPRLDFLIICSLGSSALT
eukprot:m.33422 g.33422  ORF g.33422 m.33422 type:complete len:85 (+) comp5099_c0_seq2:1360-1614(+)